MVEIEAQTIRRDQRAGLAGMLTQYLVQRGMQEVGRGVIAHDIVAAAHVHLG